MVAGKETAANTMIELAGAVNAVRDYEGYKPLTAEAVVCSMILPDGTNLVAALAAVRDANTATPSVSSVG